MSTQMKKGAITLVDILGWKGIWQREIDPVEKLKDFLGGLEERVKLVTEAATYKKQSNIFRGLEVEVHSISDTIALVTYHDNALLALEFHAYMSGIMVGASITRGIPIRGATAYGEFVTDNNIMVGPAIDEVAAWYEAADWIGVIQTPSAYFATDINMFSFFKLYLKEYNVPIKGIGNFKTNCVDWSVSWDSTRSKEQLIEHFSKMGALTPSIAKKYSNTLDFYNHKN